MMLLQLAVAHRNLAVAAALALILAAGAILLARATRPPRARHRADGRALPKPHAARHIAHRRTPRHRVTATPGPAMLGRTPDGDITLIHAAPPAEPAIEFHADDEPTVERPALVGAS